MVRNCRQQSGLPAPAVLLLLLLAGVSASSAGAADPSAESRMAERLAERIRRDPTDASSWRLLGRLKLKAGEPELAIRLLEESARLDPDNAAVQFDLGTACLQLNRPEDAQAHFANVVRLAPTSNYAAQAQSWLPPPAAELPVSDAESADSEIALTGFEIARFDNSDVPPASDEIQDVLPAEPLRPWHFRLETGALYNSNVALTPISRELFNGQSGSGQLFVAPEFEYRVIDEDSWGTGPIFRGHFTQNENEFSHLSLQSYQPGLFVEKVFAEPGVVIVPRLEYSFSHDEFDGRTLGNRHSLIASAAAVQDCGDLTFGYVSVDNTNFTGDGDIPELTSQDGWTFAVGASQNFAVDHRWLKSVRIGVDVQHADLVGSDYRYRGISLYTDAEIPLTETVSFRPEAGWGYRDYMDFTGDPSRNEHIWRAAARLVKRINEHWSVSAVVNYDRFDSDNAAFSAERYTPGVTVLFEY